MMMLVLILWQLITNGGMIDMDEYVGDVGLKDAPADVYDSGASYILANVSAAATAGIIVNVLVGVSLAAVGGSGRGPRRRVIQIGMLINYDFSVGSIFASTRQLFPPQPKTLR